ncbi:MAG: type B 50S ribosomal protein L31 [Myxococcales bacterium]|nr:type B 50S ribosomal protein L31 [Myxococcales bacterium]MDD9971423.1 type B 50S ribosomal protein L31 [Myxococcales bacterium]
MKADIHPTYHPCVFVDGDHEIVTRSTRTSEEKRDIDGVEHHVIRVDISGYSHPFWTGRQKVMDAAGRIERFKNKYKGQGKKK